MFEDPIDDDVPRRPDVWTDDPICVAMGATGFVQNYMVRECVETFESTPATRSPDRFDRFYFQTEHGPILVDILDDYDGRLDESRRAKHCAFKEQWCAENGRRYLPLPESDITPEKIRRLIAGAPEPEVSQPASQRKTTAAVKRGQIQRPKAAA